MFDRSLNTHLNCLRVRYNDKTSSLNELFEKDMPVSIHIQKLQVFETKICKTLLLHYYKTKF